MKIIVQALARAPMGGIESKSFRWTRDDAPLEIAAHSVESIEVHGEGLRWIRRNISGIPMLAGAGVEPKKASGFRHLPDDVDFSKPIPLDPPEVPSVKWYGDHAKFIADVIPGLLA